MASWFYASEGKQQGPFPEVQFRDLIAQGVVRVDTLVWTEGMAGWQKAAEVPGLMAGGGAPPSMPQGDRPRVDAGANGAASLSIDLGILEFTWRSIVLFIGLLLVIPAPWAVVWYTNWIVSRVHVPGRPNLSFVGSPLTFAAWYFGAIVLAIAVYLIGIQWLNNLVSIAELVLGWLFIRWFVANIASNGQPLGLSFSGSFWAYLGFAILMGLSIVTIIGWAWVYTWQMRWICQNIQGTRRLVVFNGAGLQYLWRMLVTVIASSFVIPIPWVARWMISWQLSQTELVPRGSTVQS